MSSTGPCCMSFYCPEQEEQQHIVLTFEQKTMLRGHSGGQCGNRSENNLPHLVLCSVLKHVGLWEETGGRNTCQTGLGTWLLPTTYYTTHTYSPHTVCVCVCVVDDTGACTFLTLGDYSRPNL